MWYVVLRLTVMYEQRVSGGKSEEQPDDSISETSERRITECRFPHITREWDEWSHSFPLKELLNSGISQASPKHSVNPIVDTPSSAYFERA